MSKLKSRRKLFLKTQPDYVKGGLVLWLDGEEPIMSVMDENESKISIWRDRAVSGQRANVGGLTQTTDSVVFNGINSRSKILDTEQISLSGILKSLKERTIEIVCKLNNAENVHTILLGQGNTATPEIGAAGLWYRPASGGFKVGTWDNSPAVIVTGVTERASYSIVYGDRNLNDFVFYKNGTECPKGNTAGNLYTTATSIGARLKTDGSTWEYRLSGEICCIRVYNRKLTNAERAKNLEIDKRRFGIDVG